MVYGATKRISTSFGSVATTEDGILYSSAIDDDDEEEEEEAPVERKRLFVLLLPHLGDEVVASEDESTRSDVAVDMIEVMRESKKAEFWSKRCASFLSSLAQP